MIASQDDAAALARFGTRIWFNGRLVPAAEATVSVMAHALHYGSAVFEGIRAYDTPQGPCFFALEQHVQRLLDSARIYRLPLPWDAAQIAAACHDVVVDSGLRSAYVRPLVYRGLGTLGVVPKQQPAQMAVAAMQWGSYLGEGALERGVRVAVSSWTRLAPNTMPTHAKAAGNYLSSQLIAMEAKRHGYDEAIALDSQGFVSEGPGENVFMVRDGALVTPPQTASILPGITRQAIIHLARQHGLTVHVENISREALYLAGELFYTGTAAEVTPIVEVDGLQIGDGRRGPVTARLQDLFFGLFRGRTVDPAGWLTPVKKAA